MQHPNMSFFEKQNNSKTSFLGIKITQEENKL